MEEIGIPAKEMLQIFRINRAIRMLAEEPNANLAGISYLCGYFDQSHFIKDIRKIAGISPVQLQGIETSKEAVHNRLFIKV
jgi:AraC-like DNA-binding protein